jgi:hypothetical protein
MRQKHRSLVAVIVSCAALFSAQVFAAAPKSAAKKAGSQPVAQATSAPRAIGIAVEPKSLALEGPRAQQHMTVTAALSDGSLRDVTRDKNVTYTFAHSRVAKMGQAGVVAPVGDGATTLTVQYQNFKSQISVKVKGAMADVPINFTTEVEPVLTKAGCNQGACHGAQYGKGGFKLSLLSYDTDLDYRTLTRQAEGRRVMVHDPANSLILKKATMTAPHGGGLRFDVGSWEYNIVKDWVGQGAQSPHEMDPMCVRLEVTPRERVLKGAGEEQQIVVRAIYSNGKSEDVTQKARYNSSEESVATVTGGVGYSGGQPGGLVRVVGRGETIIMVRYMEAVAVSRIYVPFEWPLPKMAKFPANNFIDELTAKKWAKLAIQPSEISSDDEFLRRVFLDVIGTLPTPNEVRQFLSDKNPQKRSQLIDALLGLNDEYAAYLGGDAFKNGERDYWQLYVDFWTLKWSDLFRVNRDLLTPKGMYSFQRWIRDNVAKNAPFNEMVRQMLVSQGSCYENGAANYYRFTQDPRDVGEATAQALLGIRVGCARCHNHPFEKWTQNDYYGFASFFARVGGKNPEQNEYQNTDFVVINKRDGEVQHPKNGRTMKPKPLDGEVVLMDNPEQDRRDSLAKWTTSADNPFFPMCTANRIWRHLMGRGLIEPVDDVRATNPPTNEELMNALTKFFTQNNFDVRALIRLIANSRTYQLTFKPNERNERDDKNFSHYIARRLSAEQLLDAIGQVTAQPDKFPGLPSGTKAIQLPDNKVQSYFLDVFGRPARTISCECERTGAPNIAQALHLMNSPAINQKISANGGRVDQLVQSGKSDREVVEDLYLWTVGRFPTREEMQRAEQQIAQSQSRKAGVEDVFWALINTKEFVFTH